MGKLSRERVQKHLENLLIQIGILRDLQKEKQTNLLKDVNKCYAVYHAFLLAIQNVMDIGGHILVAHYKIPFDEYKEIMQELYKQGVISQGLYRQCKGIAEFRNLLVHGYLQVEPKKVYGYLQKDLPVLEKFVQEITKFIDKL